MPQNTTSGRVLLAVKLCASRRETEEPTDFNAHVETCTWCQAYLKNRREVDKYSISEVCVGCRKRFADCMCGKSDGDPYCSEFW
jgi:hypothetical protein